jgi:hypothetical protein
MADIELPITLGAHVRVRATKSDGSPHPHAGKTGTVTKFIEEGYSVSAMVRVDKGIKPQGFLLVSLECLEADALPDAPPLLYREAVSLRMSPIPKNRVCRPGAYADVIFWKNHPESMPIPLFVHVPIVSAWPEPSNPQATVVTFLLTPEEASRLMLARSEGRISLGLKRRGIREVLRPRYILDKVWVLYAWLFQ